MPKVVKGQVKSPGCEHQEADPDQPSTSGRDSFSLEQDAVLARHEFHLLERLVGKFDLDGSTANGIAAQVPDCCSVHDLLAKDVSGKRIFVRPRVDEVKGVLRHYHACSETTVKS